MARKVGPSILPKDLNRQTYEAIRKLELANNSNQSTLSAVLRGEDEAGNPLVDLTDYFKLSGRPLDQVARGSTRSGGNLTLGSTINATKGSIFLGVDQQTAYDETNLRLGISSPTPGAKLEIKQPGATAAYVPNAVFPSNQLSVAQWTNEDGSTATLDRITKTTNSNSTFLKSTAIPGVATLLMPSVPTQTSAATIRLIFYGRWHGTGGAFGAATFWDFSLYSSSTQIWANAPSDHDDNGVSYTVVTGSVTLDTGYVAWQHTLTVAEINAINALGASAWNNLKFVISCSGGGTGYSGTFELASTRIEIVGATSVDLVRLYDTNATLITGVTAAGVFYHVTGAGTGKQFTSDSSGNATWTAPNLLSLSHGDTLADTVVRGDLIVGNSTPKWARLPRGSAGQILEMVGSDPTWSSASGLTTRVQHDWRANGPYRVDTSVDGAFVAPTAMTISAVRIWRRLAGTSGQTRLDLNKNGVTMYTTQANRPTILASAGDNATNLATLPDILSIAAGDKITVDTDEIEGGRPRDWVLIIEGS